MKIEVDIEKKHFFGLMIIGLIVIGVIGAYAYNSAGTGGNPAVFGHSVDEVDWSKMIKGNISAEGICIGTDCRASWPSGGGAGGSQWTTSGSNIYYNSGNVSTTNFMKTEGVCIGNECRTNWTSGGAIRLYSCYDKTTTPDSGHTGPYLDKCDDGDVMVGVWDVYSIHDTYGYFITKLRCCKIGIA